VITALDRFTAKCRFDPYTGCVLWIGGTTSGRGNTARYGSFWYEGERWYAHRWSAQFIHGQDVAGLQVGHCCPHGPNTLCVEHVKPQTQFENLRELNGRRRVEQSADVRQFWLLVSLGYEEPDVEFRYPPPLDVPWYDPPAWLPRAPVSVECPF